LLGERGSLFNANFSLPNAMPVIDPSKAIHQALEPEVETRGLPLKGLAARAAKQMAAPKRVATCVCSKNQEKHVKEEGVMVHFEKVFREG
jgi:hypothetical protein